MSCESVRESPLKPLKNSFVPDLAIVPRCAMTSSRVMPMPLSRTVTVLFVEEYEMRLRALGELELADSFARWRTRLS